MRSVYMLKLQKIIGSTAQEVFEVSSSAITIGREPENSLVVDSDAVSRQHGCIQQAGNHWIYIDLDSSNGSWLNGVQVNGGQRRLLRNGDILQLANFAIRIVSGADKSVGATESSAIIFSGEHFQQDIALLQSSEIVSLALSGTSVEVAREARDSDIARIEQKNGILLRILNTDVPTQVNGSVVAGEMRLVDRDEVRLRDCAIIINDAKSVQSLPGESFVTDAPMEPGADAYDRFHRPPHLQPRDSGWESEAVRRRMESGRKFVFGSAPAQIDVAQTQTLKSVPMHLDDDLLTSPLHRFSHLRQGRTGEPLSGIQKVGIAVAVGVLVVVFGWAAIGMLGM